MIRLMITLAAAGVAGVLVITATGITVRAAPGTWCFHFPTSPPRARWRSSRNPFALLIQSCSFPCLPSQGAQMTALTAHIMRTAAAKAAIFKLCIPGQLVKPVTVVQKVRPTASSGIPALNLCSTPSQTARWTGFSDPCANNPCGSHAMCRLLGQQRRGVVPGHTCDCNSGYTHDTHDSPCHYNDPCHGVSCGSHGTCRASGSSHTCDCRDGYTGSSCQYDPCHSRNCGSHGTCRVSGSSYTCDCRDGYTDELVFPHNSCRVPPTSPCDGVSCGSHGTCRVSGSSHQCDCRDGYTGSSCQYDPCHGVSCGSHGTCRVSGSSHHCDCSNGYTGSSCQYDPCHGVSCGSHGTCRVSGSSHHCDCRDGYTGSSCQYDPCHGVSCGSHGTCRVSGSSHHCDCSNGYTGSSCQTFDDCYGVQCGSHGSCSGGTCVCDSAYSGVQCQIHGVPSLVSFSLVFVLFSG
eukprot:COSAG02_NODE_147_length_33939_cov_6.689539_9_plen_460_part_00